MYDIGALVLSPLLPPKVCFIDPCFINVDQDLVLVNLMQQLDGSLLPEHQVSYTVDVNGSLLYFPETHVQMVLHNVVGFISSAIEGCVFIDVFDDSVN